MHRLTRFPLNNAPLFGNHFLLLVGLGFSWACTTTVDNTQALGEACNELNKCKSGLACSETSQICIEVINTDEENQDAADGSENSSSEGNSTDNDATTGDGNQHSNDNSQADDANVCALIDVAVESAIPTIVLLIDQSGSMRSRFPSGSEVTRWEAVYDALMNNVDGVVTRLENQVRFGVALYSARSSGESGAPATGTCPEITAVDPALANFSAIDSVYAPEEPIQDTPTGEAISAILPMFDTVTEPGPRAILLATDGEPDTCEQANPQEGQDEAVAAAQAAYSAGIQTFILSVGNEIGEEHQEEMANAGAGLDRDHTPHADFYTALQKEELLDSLNSIVNNIRTCVFELNPAQEGDLIATNKAHLGEVKLNNSNLEYDTENGWSFYASGAPCFTDKQCIEVKGTACDQLKNDANATLQARFPCDALLID